MLLSWLSAAFIIIPVLELGVFLRMHEAFGLLNTLGLVVVTGFAGAVIARAQGMIVFMEIQRDLAQGLMPAPRLIDGLMILIAGILLITPGLITDIAGLLLLVPFVRTVLKAWMKSRFERMIRDGQVSIWR